MHAVVGPAVERLPALLVGNDFHIEGGVTSLYKQLDRQCL